MNRRIKGRDEGPLTSRPPTTPFTPCTHTRTCPSYTLFTCDLCVCACENVCVCHYIPASQVATGAERTRSHLASPRDTWRRQQLMITRRTAAHIGTRRSEGRGYDVCVCVCVCVGEREGAIEGHRWVLYFKNKTMFAFKKDKK